jgi:hypothetical protein
MMTAVATIRRLVVLVSLLWSGLVQADVNDPVQCWWRTGASAVRVGEAFSIVLTCRVVETDPLTAVVDRSKLDPTAVQLAPFDVLGGRSAPDLTADQHRFFQYEYNVRLISDLLFDADVALPDVKVAYRLQTRDNAGEAILGIEQTHTLPPEHVHVASLVPDSATDIRDALPTTFAQADAQSLSGDVLVSTGIGVSAVGALFVAFAVARLASLRRGAAGSAASWSPAAVLGGVGRELSAVRRQRETGGWTPDLVERTLKALRVAGGYGLARPITQRAADDHRPSPEGALVMQRPWPRGRRVLVSGSVTAETAALALARTSREGPHDPGRLREIQTVLAAFTEACYGERPLQSAPGLDETLSQAEELVGRLRAEHRWPARALRALSGRRPLRAPR